MRKVIDLQMEFWKTDIANIEFDLQSRDEIPKLLMGLQYIHRTAAVREKVTEVLKTNSTEKKLRKRKTRHGSMEDSGFGNSAFKLQLGLR